MCKCTMRIKVILTDYDKELPNNDKKCVWDGRQWIYRYWGGR